MKKSFNYQILKATQTVEQLVKRFGDKSFTERNKWLKVIALAFSYGINILSAIGAFYGVFFLLSFAIPYDLITGVLTIGLLVLLEISMRKSSDSFWDIFWSKREVHKGWLSFSAALCILSMAISSFGLWQGTQDFAPTAAIIIEDTELTELKEQKEELQKSIKNAENTRWKGTTTTRSQDAIKEFSKSQTKLLEAISLRTDYINRQNAAITNDHNLTIGMVIKITIGLYLFFQFLFEMCMSFCSYYDFQLLIELDPQAAKTMFAKQVPQPIQQAQTQVAPVVKQLPKQKKKKVKQSKTEQPKIAAKTHKKIGFLFGQNNAPKQPHTEHQTETQTEPETTQNIVPQQITEPKTVSQTKTKIVSEDVSKWRNYAQTYYKRSIKPTSKQQTRADNRIKYLEFKELLETAGYTLKEGSTELIIDK